jgi:hypothetical protein
MYGRMQMTASILRDTGILMNTLSPTLGMPGQIEEGIPYGVLVGIGGSDPHDGGGFVTIADIAMFHQFGGGNLPKREILVEPSDDVIESMTDDMLRAVAKIIQDASGTL